MPAPKAPALRSVLRDFDRVLKEPAEQTRAAEILARAVVMALAAALAEQDYRNEVGMGVTHQRLLVNSGKSLLVNARRSYSKLASEARTLLKKGPQKYYAEALAQLAAFSPGN